MIKPNMENDLENLKQFSRNNKMLYHFICWQTLQCGWKYNIIIFHLFIATYIEYSPFTLHRKHKWKISLTMSILIFTIFIFTQTQIMLTTCYNNVVLNLLTDEYA